MQSWTWRQGGLILALYLLLAAVQSWPLPLHMGTHLTGAPTGDTGVYVWNLWVFRHEIITTGTTPFSTLQILPLAGPTDLSLHNYTVFSDLLALPLLTWFDIITTFNVVYLVNVALAGMGLFLLARRLTGRTPEAFLAGLLFAWSPFLVARGQEHFSLVAAAPLPIFMLLVLRAWDHRRLRDAALAGIALAWATYSDPYYGVYCVMLAAGFGLSRMLIVGVRRRLRTELVRTRRALTVAMGLAGGLIAVVHFGAGSAVELGPLRISMRTLYTPVLILTVLALARAAVALRISVALAPVPLGWVSRATATGVGVAAAVLSPTLYAMAVRMLDGRLVPVPVLWRSSAPGVDVLSLLMPNPNHAWMPEGVVNWLATGPGGYVENVAALSWVGLAVIIAAWRFTRFQPGRFWPCVTIGFALLALGPFVNIAGLNTLVPTPWALLRYAPIVGSARMPSRFAVVTTMGFAVLFAFALAAIATTLTPGRRRALLSAVGILIGLELVPAPRQLHSAQLPTVFERVAADPRPVRVLELPTGIRDGLSSLGDFNASAQLRQTMHEKGLIGGYLSRVSSRRKNTYLSQPVTRALLDVSEGREINADVRDEAHRHVKEFLRASNVGYVTMSRKRTNARLREFAIELLRLEKIDEAGGYELFVPRIPN